jgi:hypothetical protein
VGDDDLEQDLAVGEITRKLEQACKDELTALDQRMAVLLDRPGLGHDGDPLGPATFCAALKNACEQLSGGNKARTMVLQKLEGYLTPELDGLYNDLNRLLAMGGVLPELRVADRRTPVSFSFEKPAEARKPTTPAPSETTKAEIFGTLAQLLGSSAPNVGFSAAWAPIDAKPAPRPFLDALTRLHQGLRDRTGGPDILVHELKALKGGPLAKDLSSVDAMMIDIVAMLFDHVFDDARLPSSIRELLGRLRVPTLKVALADKTFFSNKAHPMRRLLDALAGSAMPLAEAEAPTSAAFPLIERVVGRVLAELDLDFALLDELTREVEQFMAPQDAIEQGVVERSARVIEAREREETAQQAASEEVAARLANRRWVPPAVREMLLETWTRAMARMYMAEGEGSEGWKRLSQAAKELLWSVEPKATAEDRDRLVKVLPAMIKLLNEGFALAQMPDADRTTFLGKLADFHAMAVKAGKLGPDAAPEPPPAPTEPEDARLARESVAAGDVTVEEIRLRTSGGKPHVRDVATRTGMYTNLQRGTWVQVKRPDDTVARMRLTWISPNQGVYLFTNPLVANAAMSISPEALAELMRSRSVRMIDPTPLVERNVHALLASLRPKAATATVK